MKYEQTEKTDYYRDMSSGAVVNRNREALEAYKKRKNRAKQVDQMSERLSHIESEMTEIRSMFSEVLNKLDKS